MRNGFFIGFNRTDCLSTEIMRHLQYPFGSKYGPLFFSILSDAGTKKVIQSIIQDTIYTLRVTSWEIRGLADWNSIGINQRPGTITQQQ
jgi:hypothetical protein